MPRPKTRSIWMYDLEVEEIFDCRQGKRRIMNGQVIARYFEALRYRQQLNRAKPFLYKASQIEKNTGLTYKRQLFARAVLEATGWIKTERVGTATGNGTQFQLTPTAFELIAHIPHRQDMQLLNKRFKQAFKGAKKAVEMC